LEFQSYRRGDRPCGDGRCNQAVGRAEFHIVLAGDNHNSGPQKQGAKDNRTVSDDGLRVSTPEAIRPASNPPSRTRGKMAKIAKFESADVPVFWPRLAKRPGRLSCDGRGDLGSSIN